MATTQKQTATRKMVSPRAKTDAAFRREVEMHLIKSDIVCNHIREMLGKMHEALAVVSQSTKDLHAHFPAKTPAPVSKGQPRTKGGK